MKVSISLVLLAVGVWIASSLFQRFGMSQDLAAAVLLALGFMGLQVYRVVLKKPLDRIDLLLSLPVLIAWALVILKESGMLAVPSVVIWASLAILSILALGYATPADDRPDKAH